MNQLFDQDDLSTNESPVQQQNTGDPADSEGLVDDDATRYFGFRNSNTIPDGFGSLRLPDISNAPSFLGSALTIPQVYVSGAGSEEGREPAYREELLSLFRQRLRLVAGLAMITIPAFTIFYWALMPQLIRPISAIYIVLWTYCAFVRHTASRLGTLTAARIFSLVSYSVFSIGASAIFALPGEHNALIFGGHNHIMLSVLLMPFALWECAIVGFVVNGSLAVAGWQSIPSTQSYLYASHMFVMVSTTFFILCIAQLQSLLRRRAFDAAFDVMRSASKLQTLSFLDTLTGGFNRRHLDKMMDIEVARAIRFARPLSVIMFDLDNFKQVNDTRGHSAGDEVLREVWGAANTTIREVDTLARYGGDEFSLILPETDEGFAHVIGERLQVAVIQRLTERFGAKSLEATVTLSIGITTVRPTEMINPDKILDSADARLYEAKRYGKNRIAD